jgi:hypothetical protein
MQQKRPEHWKNVFVLHHLIIHQFLADKKKLLCVLIHQTHQTWHPVISDYSQKLNLQ